MNKYNAKKVEIDGIVFDSRAEGRFYEHLLDLMHDGIVESFEMQKPYTLLDKFPHPKNRQDDPRDQVRAGFRGDLHGWSGGSGGHQRVHEKSGVPAESEVVHVPVSSAAPGG